MLAVRTNLIGCMGEIPQTGKAILVKSLERLESFNFLNDLIGKGPVWIIKSERNRGL